MYTDCTKPFVAAYRAAAGKPTKSVNRNRGSAFPFVVYQRNIVS